MNRCRPRAWDALEKRTSYPMPSLLYASRAARPANAAAHAHLGGLQMHLGRASEAKASLERAIELDPHQADPRFLLGNVGFEEGQLQEAIDCYFRAITIEPDDMESHTNICSA